VSARWMAETEEMVALTIESIETIDLLTDVDRDAITTAVLTALADAGLLVEPGTINEWGAPRSGMAGVHPCQFPTACEDDTHVRRVSPWVETGRCDAQYERPGGRERGDRIVRCSMPKGHEGTHYEGATEAEWPAISTEEDTP
jgi:hypothetical protein